MKKNSAKQSEKPRAEEHARKMDIPVEFLKALAAEQGNTLWPLLHVRNKCWNDKAIPSAWITSAVSLIYKNGDPADYENYRPICLLTIRQKPRMPIIKQRLLDSWVEQVLWPTQFGFRSGYSTDKAI